MEVILLEDVKTLGKKGDIVKVNDGYGRNFILPKKLGIEATPKNLNDLKSKKQSEERKRLEHLNEAKVIGGRLENSTVTLKIKTGEKGKSFGSISTKEIAAAVKEQLGLDIDKKKLVLAEPIKYLGVYKVPVKLGKDVNVDLKVNVESL